MTTQEKKDEIKEITETIQLVSSNEKEIQNQKQNQNINTEERNEKINTNVLFESNEKRNPVVNTSINITESRKPNYLLWLLYLSVIFVVIYNLYINQETDPTKIGILIIGSIIIVFFAKRIITRNTYKVEDDDNGHNLIEG
jgi:hypothetical protein